MTTFSDVCPIKILLALTLCRGDTCITTTATTAAFTTAAALSGRVRGTIIVTVTIHLVETGAIVG